jgi:hypothetical protein
MCIFRFDEALLKCELEIMLPVSLYALNFPNEWPKYRPPPSKITP